MTFSVSKKFTAWAGDLRDTQYTLFLSDMSGSSISVKDVGKVLRNQQLHLFHSHIRYFISILSSMVYRFKRQPVWLEEGIDTWCRVSVD